MIWTTKDGREINIKDLSNSHIVNILMMLKRHAQLELELTFLDFCKGPYPRGDGAQMAFDSEFVSLCEATWEDYRAEIYDHLLREADRRGFQVYEKLIPQDFGSDNTLEIVSRFETLC